MPVWMGGFLVVLICIDMGIKQYIEDSFEKDEERETKVPGIVLRKVYNKGFLLNFLDKYPKVIKSSSVVTAAVIVVYDIWLACRKGRWCQKLSMVLLTAGAASNIYDRLARGKVIDYIGFRSRFKFLSKITANLADFYVVIGLLFFGTKVDKKGS